MKAQWIIAIVFWGVLLWGEPSPAWAVSSPWVLQSVGEYDGQYCLTGEQIRLCVNPEYGGRITDFRLRLDTLDWSSNVLLPVTVEPETYGSTFWVSPQSTWGWPPDATIDRLPYTPILEGDTLILHSESSPSWGIQVTKRIRPQGNFGIRVVYELEAIDETVHYAPWEVSRVAGSGITLFPGTTPIAPPNGFSRPPLIRQNGLTLWDHTAPSGETAQDQKAFADGAEGWLAHVDQGILFLKQFPNQPPAAIAPGEAEIEVYATASRRYLELEIQGAYTALTPGNPQTWAVQWQLRSLPSFLTVDRTNAAFPAFLNWVRQAAD